MNEVTAVSSSVGVTQALAAASRSLDYDALPDEARAVARHCLLDFLAVALAGSREPLTDILVQSVVRREAAVECALIGRAERATALTAAMVNGAAGHALDFDDTHIMMNGHPSVPVLPALLALAEVEGAGGRAFLTALVAGVELECRLGALMGQEHYATGFHATATLGTFGAAAACAHLLGLSEEGWLHALGLAGTQAAGLKSGFGTMAKPLHAGRAASTGLLSALLARGEFTANPAILEVEQGFAATHAGETPTADVLDRYTGQFLIRDTLFKYHAACYLTHAAIEAAAELRERGTFTPADISAVEVRVSPVCLGVCNIPEPTTGLEGKFSLRATTAMALVGADTRDPDTYTAERMRSPELCAVRDRVTVVPDEGLPPTCAAVRVTAGQAHYEGECNTGIPAPDLDRQWDRLSGKYFALAAPVLGEDRAAALYAAVEGIDALDSVAALTARACPAV